MKLSKLVLSLLGSLLIANAYAAPATLAERWSTLRTEQPKLQIRDAARALGVSEAQLLATNIGKGVTRLQADGNQPREIMRAALDLGIVQAITRNENGVIETTGVASKFKQAGDKSEQADAKQDPETEARQRNIAGGYLGGQIDLRFHFENWKYAFAVEQAGRDGKPTRSLQFFDANGTAVHKIYLRNEPGVAVYDKLVATFRLPQQSAELNVLAVAPKAAEKPDAEIDVKEFQLAWKDMTDVHQFAQIMREFHLSREQALRLAPAGVVERVTPEALRTLLENAAKDKVAIMVFLGNEGLTQIYSGKIEKTMAAGGFFNVLDPDFNLHIRDTALRSGWVVKRGGVTSVEFFDKDGTQVVSFFGVRERGKPQPQSWVDLADSLPKAK
ncbi:hemin-degrading factor [Janthinobacterium lividum]|uniref:ChuX/HutX family heme-like substrate-binding protein n=1 Tax=Janthinobacterium lividum TaxID=29581 RepID=A0ABU0XMT3_9BURK|nr:ChuX/HutX family heme-like substrate-binding protein [Janthinobacterium lividum]MDQ4624829.1 ChuX/HutX family heme-like substrate-binding protein [Janthinobacterium lividum]MDQ4673568.1 ChuX/HutX family heme-like substrate-binding protein [Janthinobacterium lividum]MDQ4684298.1 ChuX/HutX family heme-like substrate-binding protein [Janthinobacterium lividum]